MRSQRTAWTAAAALLLGGAAPGDAHAQFTTEPVPVATTPEGAATLTPEPEPGACARPAIAFSTSTLLTGVRVVVGPGSRADRVRVRYADDVLSDWTPLPAEPGSYVVPTRRIVYGDPFDSFLSLDQERGGIAVLTQSGTNCPTRIDVHAGDPPPGRGGAVGQALPARGLALRSVTAPDVDGDRIPDAEERTDLAVTLAATPGVGTAQLVARVVNRGPSAVNGVQLTFSAAAGTPFTGVPVPCVEATTSGPPTASRLCTLTGPLPPGGSATVPVALRTPDAPVAAGVRVAALNRTDDLAPGDEEATAALTPPAPRLTLRAPARSRIGAPIVVRLAGDRPGRFAISGRIALGGGRVVVLPGRGVALSATKLRRDVSLRPRAVQARALRRAAARGRRLTARFTVVGEAATPRTATVRLRP